MKNRAIIIGVYLLAAITTPSLLKAFNSNSYYPEERDASYTYTEDGTPIQTAQFSITRMTLRLPEVEEVVAGAPMKDSKELTTPSVAPDSDEGFSEPSAYSEYKYARIQDNRPVGFDGPQHSGIVGFDFVSFYKTIVGFNFTYTNTSLTTSNTGVNFSNSSDSYFFSNYIAKNFDDWVNLGGAFTYGRTDSNFQAQGAVTILQETAQDTYTLSPFVGVAHTWGAFSFSSTPSYIWGYDHFSFAPTQPGDIPAPPDAKTLNQTFLFLNNFQYAVTDKLSLSIQANWTRLLTTQMVPVSPGFPPASLSHQWMSFGGRADYAFNKDGSVFAAFEHDAFSTHFDDYRIRTGISYNF